MFRNIFLFLTIVFCSASVFFSQTEQKAFLVDEFGEVCSEELMARIDNFLIQISNNSSAKPLVLFYGREDTQGRNRKLADYIARYPARPGAGRPILNVVRGKDKTAQRIQFWLIPEGADEPKPDAPFNPTSYTKATLFDRAPVGFHRWSGPLDIYDDGFYDLGCNFSPDRETFAKILDENTNLNGFLIVYTEKRIAKTGLRLASFALNDLVGNFNIPRRRIRAVYGGTRKVAEIEFWLVPRGSTKPPIRNDLPPIRSFR